MADKPQPRPRDAYRHFLPITTRWRHFVHVYLDRDTRKPVPLPAALRAALDPLSV